MRHVLFITYYFPPSGGPGVQRVLKWVRYVREYGWEPVVLTVEDGEYPARDPTLCEEVPEDVAVYRTTSWSPYRIYARLTGKKPEDAVSVGFLDQRSPDIREKLARWIRANLFLPDARVGWVPFAVRQGVKTIEADTVEAVVSSGPPHSTHLVGRSLHRRTGLPWVADFRDPWTDIDYYSKLPMTRWAQYIDRRLEQSVLDEAARITSVSENWCNLLGGKTRTPAVLIRNGFDPNDFDTIEPIASNEFVLSHVGNLLPARNPEGLWRVLGRLRRSGKLPELRLRFVGNVDVSVRRSLKENDLEEITDYVPYVPPDEALAYMMGSSVLLLTINKSTGPEFEGHIPGKLYEYLAAGRPVLGIGSADAEVARILRETGGGQMVDFEEEAAVERLVHAYYTRWSEGDSLDGSTPAALTPFTRQFQAGQLAELLDGIV